LITRLAPRPKDDLGTPLSRSPWERGTNENTDGLFREYFPKGTEITDDQTYLALVARELNNRPRRILDYRTPAEVFTDLLTSSIATTG
jgi:IS30 family transposase